MGRTIYQDAWKVFLELQLWTEFQYTDQNGHINKAVKITNQSDTKNMLTSYDPWWEFGWHEMDIEQESKINILPAGTLIKIPKPEQKISFCPNCLAQPVKP